MRPNLRSAHTFILERKSVSSLRVMLIADVHMLGNVRGHWLDRMKREGQMRASFQAAVRNLSPDIVFILGDVLDEGKYAYPHEFSEVTQRFNRYFTSFMNQQISRDGHSGKKVEVHVVTGNHDIGFHYDTNYYKVSRFEESYNTSKVKIVSQNGVHFLLLNSVLMRNDSCFLCDKTQDQLREAQRVFKCLSKSGSDGVLSSKCSNLIRWHKLEHASHAQLGGGISSKPIILQHFPLYRVSERDCFEADWTSDNLNLSKPLREDWDMLSEVVSRNLLSMFKPRLVLSGHAHYRCDIWHSYSKDAKDKTLEVTINSFSWRNNDQPQILLLNVDQTNFVYSVCYLPRESVQIAIYLFIWCYNLIYLFRKCRDDQQRVSYLPFWKIYAFSRRFQLYHVSNVQKLR